MAVKWALLALSLVSSYPALAFSLHNHPDSDRVKESIPPPFGWAQGPRAPPDHTIELRIALPQSNFALLEKHLYEISDPQHTRYGQHLSKKQVETLVAPPAKSVDRVHSWLGYHGLRSLDVQGSPAGDWLTARVPIRVAERMLNTVRPVTISITLAYPDKIYRNIIFGRTSKAVTPSSGRFHIVFLPMCSITLN